MEKRNRRAYSNEAPNLSDSEVESEAVCACSWSLEEGADLLTFSVLSGEMEVGHLFTITCFIVRPTSR